jgi:hypothetical protein
MPKFYFWQLIEFDFGADAQLLDDTGPAPGVRALSFVK